MKISRAEGAPLTFEVCLQALCLSRNRLKALPAYIGTMADLRVLKIDGNPLVYPPRHISEQPQQQQQQASGDAARHDEWLVKLQEYLRLNGMFCYMRSPVRQKFTGVGRTGDAPAAVADAEQQSGHHSSQLLYRYIYHAQF